MNSKTIKRAGILLAAMIVILSIIMMIQTSMAHADSMTEKKFAKKVTVTTNDYFVYLNMGSKTKSSHKVKASSSKKSVIKTEVYEGDVYLTVKKTGTATVTIKNKSTHKTYKCTVKVVKYKNPFKVFRFAGKNVTKKFKTYHMGSTTVKKAKAKLSIKPKSGWKIKKIIYSRSKYNSKKDKYVGHKKAIRNNKTIKVSKTDEGSSLLQVIIVKMYSKKSNATFDFFLDF